MRRREHKAACSLGDLFDAEFWLLVEEEQDRRLDARNDQVHTPLGEARCKAKHESGRDASSVRRTSDGDHAQVVNPPQLAVAAHAQQRARESVSQLVRAKRGSQETHLVFVL